MHISYPVVNININKELKEDKDLTQSSSVQLYVIMFTVS